MPEVEQLLYTHQELTELMLKDRGITSGHWAIFLKLRLLGGNMEVEGSMRPAAIALVDGVGLQRTDPTFPLAVDAGKLSGAKRARAAAAQKST
jgi:hypothetical protein